VIDVNDVWKKYRLGVLGTGTLRHDVERWWHRIRGKPDPYSKVDQMAKPESTNAKVESPKGESDGDLGDDEMWALRGVSFEVKQGEILGIIGRNGAGKSTLLKILSRVTLPTNGAVRVKGRIASLLEVGTGFHPELTGRENTFLNGAILGMSRSEIKAKFDEIVAFAGIETYIETPVKRYSSGMYVRLAFAVAAHLDPEILIVDEVLAVGDAEFQKKCLGKMGEVAHEGRTVLFVSHNMSAVVTLCSAAMWINDGKVIEIGSANRLVDRYTSKYSAATLANTTDITQKPRSGTGAARFSKLRVRVAHRGDSEIIVTGESLQIELEITSIGDIAGANVAVIIYDMNSTRLIDVNTALKGDFLSL